MYANLFMYVWVGDMPKYYQLTHLGQSAFGNLK